MSGASLPPGFRFHPTDEELVGYYLKRKVEALEIELEIIPVVDLYKFDPWELPEKSFLPKRDMEWFFFCPRDRKYPNGSRTNRATKAGYWKATGKDRKIVCRSESVTAYRKTLVFYCGRAPLGDRTEWIMHEYRLSDELVQGSPSFHGAFALCRVAKKNESTQKSIVQPDDLRGKILETRSTNDEFTPTDPVIKPSAISSDISLNASYLDSESRYSTPLTSPAKITPISDFEPILSHSTDPASFWVSPELILDSSKDYPQLQAAIPDYFRQYDYSEPMPVWLSHNHTEISPCSSYSNFPVDNELSGDLDRAGYMSLGGAEDIQNGSFYYDHTSSMWNHSEENE